MNGTHKALSISPTTHGIRRPVRWNQTGHEERREHGHHKKRLATVRQRTSRVVHGFGSNRFAVPEELARTGLWRDRDIRAGRPHCMAHASPWADAHRHI